MPTDDMAQWWAVLREAQRHASHKIKNVCDWLNVRHGTPGKLQFTFIDDAGQLNVTKTRRHFSFYIINGI
jgi:hypothetical protein